jgi:acetylornithine deacetylase/succinyl-diaminopimelate desuccinylase-like protein
MFAGHVDVVGAEGEWSSPPFKLTLQGSRLYGRGTSDMKAAIAAFVSASVLVTEVEGFDDRTINMVLTGDEEVGSQRGMIALLRDEQIASTWTICGEPTGLRVFYGNRGTLWMEATIIGKGGHAGLSHQLINPVDLAADVIRDLRTVDLAAHDGRFNPPSATVTVTGIIGSGPNGAVNVIPDRVRLRIDRRLVPGEDASSLFDRISMAINASVPPPARIETTLIKAWPPYLIDPEHPLVRAARTAVAESHCPSELGTDLASDDSSWLGGAGIPTIILGPGAPEQAHATDEHIFVEELEKAIEIYTRLICTALAR